ncbi:SasC/FmtB family protein [Staphylococcus capitis]|nr:SasC/FmtB family protein [Staphylococcus capitis]MDS0967388.1 YSIRK signal domain/LPXTG anchor domain surface protein [Staphylococcus capitis]PNY89446.1 YSIRK signal domain/LPXTG anchor domain surface protein [Staphylococcus capitis subsp. urealyticus]
MENKRINNLDKKITRFSIRKYQGFGAASVAIIGFIMMSNINYAKADSIEQNNTTINQKVSDSTSHQINIENGKSLNDNLTNNQDIENKLSTTKTNTQHVINTSQLEKILNQYKSLDLSNKTEDSVELFRADLQEAESILNNPQSQQQVDDYYHKFLNSAGKLHNKESLLPNRQSNGVQSQHVTKNNNISNYSYIRHKRDTSSFRSAPENNVSNDPLKANEVNPEIQNGNFSQISGGILPSRSKRLTVVTNVDNWHSYSTDPNPEYPMFYTPSAVDYSSFMSNGGAPYGVVLARTNNGRDRSVNDAKVAGIYQDIDVVPGSELNVNFISTSPVFSDGASGAKLKISNIEQDRVLFDNRLNGMGPYPTGKLSAMVNIPSDMNRVRISFLPISNTGRISVQRSSKEHGFGDNSSYYHGGSVSDVRINSGSYITSNVAQVEYITQPNSPNDNFARATVNLSVENKGHNQSRDTYYEVLLPANSKLISSSGGTGNLDVNTNKLRMSISNLNPGERKDLSYTVEFKATIPKIVNLNGHVSYRTNATFRGRDTQRTGDNTVNLQTVTIQMNKTELQSKVNEVDNYLHDLNEADFTTDSWRALQDKLTEARNIINEQQNNVAIENQASQETINNVTNTLDTLKNSLKYNAPSKPIIEINYLIPNLTITPANKADKLNIIYQNTANERTSIIATKTNDNWSLNNSVPGINIEPQSGLVTINYQAVYPESVVVANDIIRNSDTSEESRENMPRKDATPEAPGIEASEEHVNVEVTPKGEASKIEIIYINPEGEPASINAIKNGETWKLDKQVSQINIDDHTGKVTVGYQAVQAESEIVATETKGNSDSSSESKLKMPRKETKPEAPDIESNVEHVNVEVTPKDESTKLVINYTNTEGQSDTIIVSKNGEVWSLNKNVPHIEVDEASGKVTIGYQAVQAVSEVITTETKGNSDSSPESKVTMPRKDVAPEGPVLKSDHDNASVSIIPSINSDKITIKYLDVNDQIATAIATKKNQSWSLNNNISGISINSQTGTVTISYVAVQPESDITATASNGNSDNSIVKHTIMPAKEVKPQPPVVRSNIEEANVEIIPHNDVTRLDVHYVDLKGQPATITATKVGNGWTINNNISNIKLDESTGKLTMGHQAVLVESEIVATETKGNSDESAESKINMPRKESTPDSPTIEANEERVNVEVTPKGESTKLIINYTNSDGQPDSIIAIKKEEIWSLNKEVPYIQLDETTGVVTIGHQAVLAESEIVATETKGNSDTSAESKVTMPRKEVTPESPAIESNEEHVNVEVTPKGESTKLVINYTNSEGQPDSIIAIKKEEIWSLNKEVPHIQLDEYTGKVTLGHPAVQAESEIVATETKGNSNTSAESKVTMPRKESTPDSPTIEANEERVNVEVTPKGESTKLVINYTNSDGQPDSIIASKKEGTWSLNKETPHIEIDDHTGKVTIGYQDVQTESEIVATETKGNSDTSPESKINMPRKEVTPESPAIEANEEHVNVEVTPKGESTKLVINYTNSDGQPDSIIASKIGETWSLNKEVPYIQLNETIGKVTLGHQAVLAESEIVAIETKGNSDVSAESKINMPRKEATPDAPIVEKDESKVNVSIIPSGLSTKMEIDYTNPEGKSDTIIARKDGLTWSLSKEITGINIEPATGKVTIDYYVVYPESEITASEVHGNSDHSKLNSVIMPRKENAPEPPIVTVNEKEAKVIIKPRIEATKVEINFKNKKGKATYINVYKNGSEWSVDQVMEGIILNAHTGEIKITHLAFKDGSEIIAREYKGNSDASIAISIKAPTKVTSKESYKIKSSKVKLNDRSNEKMYTKKDKLIELPHTGESEKANKTLLSSILILGLMLLRKSRKKEI